MKPEIESLQSYVALSFIIIGLLVRYCPTYLNLSFPHNELLFNSISFAFFFLGIPIVIYQVAKFDRRLTIFFSSASILFLFTAFLQFEMLGLKILDNSSIEFIIRLVAILSLFLGIVILMAGIGYKKGLKK